MKRTSIPLFIILVATSPSLVAAQPDLSKLPPPATKAGLTYAHDIRPLFEASCFRCHGDQRQRNGLRLDSLEAALKGGDDGKDIVPGHSKESPLVIAIAQLDEEKSMPPKQRGGQFGGGPGGFGGRAGRGPDGTNGPGAGRGAGGFGGFGGGGTGFGMFGRGALAQVMISQGDKDKDQKLTKAEFGNLSDTWYDKIDADKAGKLNKSLFTERLGKLLVPSQQANAAPADPSAGNQRPGAGGTGLITGGLFTAADTDRDGSVTRSELRSTFEKWFAEWDSEKTGALNEESLYAGLRAALPQQTFGGFGGGGPAGGGGGRGPAGPGGPGGGPGGAGFGGPAPKPLTAEQVGLVRAWIDQGAK